MKNFICGFLTAFVILYFAMPVFGTIGSYYAIVDYNNIKITLNGKQVTPTDANGQHIEPFAIDGTTYLPVRAISNALGLNVNWDENTKTVQLTSKSGDYEQNMPTSNGNLTKEQLLGSWITIMYYAPDGTDYNLEQYAETYGVDVYDVVLQYTFNADGTVDLLLLSMNATASGTYEINGNSVTVDFAGDRATLVLDQDGTLFMDNSASGQTSVRFMNYELI